MRYRVRYRVRRNFWISVMSLTLWLVLFRLYKIMVVSLSEADKRYLSIFILSLHLVHNYRSSNIMHGQAMKNEQPVLTFESCGSAGFISKVSTGVYGCSSLGVKAFWTRQNAQELFCIARSVVPSISCDTFSIQHV
jgi:hypothetical protein